jgi:hypothetical protein
VKLGEKRPYHPSGDLNMADWLTQLFSRKEFVAGDGAEGRERG